MTADTMMRRRSSLESRTKSAKNNKSKKLRERCFLPPYELPGYLFMNSVHENGFFRAKNMFQSELGICSEKSRMSAKGEVDVNSMRR